MSRLAKYERAKAAQERAPRQRDPNAPVLRVALVGCCKEKKANAQGFALARDLYQSTLFRKSLEHAEANFEHVLILSAMKGAIELTDPVRIYDFEMSERTEEERAEWGHEVMCWQLSAKFRDYALELHVFAGRDYAEPLRWQLPEFPGWSVVEPMAGLQVGERLHWLNERRAA